MVGFKLIYWPRAFDAQLEKWQNNSRHVEIIVQKYVHWLSPAYNLNVIHKNLLIVKGSRCNRTLMWSFLFWEKKCLL